MGYDGLAATDRDDDFQFVAVTDHGGGVLTLGDDLAVEFDRDAPAGQLEPVEQSGNNKRGIETAIFAVDGYGYHLTVQIQ